MGTVMTSSPSPMPSAVRARKRASVPLAPVMRRQAAETINPDDPATWGRVSRNAACPCNSGRKYKHCHGKVV